MPIKVRRFDFFDNLEIFEADQYQADFPLHLHDKICITLVRQGVECTQIDQREFIAPHHGISLTYPDEIHANPNKNNGPYSFLTYYISPAVLSHFYGSEKFSFKSRILQDDRLSELLADYADLSLPDENYFGEILKYLVQHHFSNSCKNTVKDNKQKLNFEEVIAYMDDHFADRLRLEKLAQMQNLSRFSFIRHFKKEKGITPAQYLTLKRIEAAKALLLQGHSITDATYAVGFYDQSHLNRNFKKMTGMTPRAYQKACNIVQDL